MCLSLVEVRSRGFLMRALGFESRTKGKKGGTAIRLKREDRSKHGRFDTGSNKNASSDPPDEVDPEGYPSNEVVGSSHSKWKSCVG